MDWMSWHPKGDVVLAGSEDFTMWMWLAQTGACMQVGAACAQHGASPWWGATAQGSVKQCKGPSSLVHAADPRLS